MARPRSEDKRNSIIAAAMRVVAEQGIGAPTSRIAREAGVAEGSLFTYFSTKDELLNQLYLEIKAGLRDEMMHGFPKAAALKNRVRYAWEKYVDWGVKNVEARKALAHLAVSERILDHTRQCGSQAFADVNLMMQESMAHGALHDQPPAFVGALMGSIADTTMDFMHKHPEDAERYRDAGFHAFWNAVVKRD
jgi:AcrR family transcriptional regulator